jgi:hypothetical protein
VKRAIGECACYVKVCYDEKKEEEGRGVHSGRGGMLPEWELVWWMKIWGGEELV